MKVVFVYPTFESLGIEYISSVLKQNGHEVELILDPRLFDDKIMCNRRLHDLFDCFDLVLDQTVQSNPDVLCFSVCTDNYEWACKYAKKLKQRLNLPVVFGGPHASICPEEVLRNDYVDYVVRGEGEYALLDLVNCLAEKKKPEKIQNIWDKSAGCIRGNPVRPLVRDLDELPFPDKSLYDNYVTDFFSGYRMIASRGCFFSCSYCHNSFLKKLYDSEMTLLRTRSVDNVIEELVQAKKNKDMRYVIFADEIFPPEEEWLRQFVLKYKKYINLPFSCFVHPLTITRRNISFLEEAGCVSVLMGLDSVDAGFNEKMCRRKINADDIAQAVKCLRNTKISLFGGYIIGYPGQKVEQVIDDLRFYNRYRPDSINVHWLRYFPGTLIRAKAEELNLITRKEIEDRESRAISCRLRKDIKKYKEWKGIVNLFYLICFLPKSLMCVLIKLRAYRILNIVYFADSFTGIFISSCLNFKNKIIPLFGVKRRNVRFTERRRFYVRNMRMILKRRLWRMFYG